MVNGFFVLCRKKSEIFSGKGNKLIIIPVLTTDENPGLDPGYIYYWTKWFAYVNLYTGRFTPLFV